MTWIIALLLVLIVLVVFAIYLVRRDTIHIIQRQIDHTLAILKTIERHLHDPQSIEDEILEAINRLHYDSQDEKEKEETE